MKNYTVEELRAFLSSKMESCEPDIILDVVRKNEGKKITKHFLKRLPGGPERWRFVDEYGWRSLKDSDYGRNVPGKLGFSYIVRYDSEGDDTFNASVFEEKNPQYFRGRRERNEARLKALSDKKLLEQCVAVVGRCRFAVSALEKVKAELAALTTFGEPLSPDWYDLERIAGVRGVK